MSKSAQTVLFADDDLHSMGWVQRLLRSEGFEVHCAATCEEALAIVSQQELDHAIIDLMFPDGSGLDLLRHVKKGSPDARVVLLTGFGSIRTAVEAIRLGAVEYLLKPVEPSELLRALEPPNGNHARKQLPELPTLDRVKWDYVQRVLDFCGGNVSEAARRLGIYRQTLQRILRRNPPLR